MSFSTQGGSIARRHHLSERLCAGAVAFFALWTLCSHVLVALGGSLRQLVAVFAVAAALGLAARWRLSGDAAPALAPGAVVAPPVEAQRAGLRLTGLALGGVALLAYAWHGSAALLWGCLAALLAGVAALAVRERPVAAVPAGGVSREIPLLALAAACALLTAFIHRPDIDDAFYVNLAVAAADGPGEALLGRDTLHGAPDLPLHLPVYRLHAYELLNGALSWLTGIPAIRCFHWIAASLGALLVPLAHAVLFRMLTPRHWPAATAALVVVLFAAGDAHRWYGNFAFVRMWQGKAFALFVFLPLVYAYALRFALRPGLAAWGWLAAAQLAALGASSSALWVAPAASLSALAAACTADGRGARRFGLGALASLYLLLAGWLARSALSAQVGLPGAAVPDLATAAREVLGDGRLAAASAFSVAVAWACCDGALARRFAAVVPLAALLVVLDPWTQDMVRVGLTGASTWRGFWSLPVPILMALVLVAPLSLGRARGRAGRAAAGLACAGLVLAFAVFVPRMSALSAANAGAGGTGMRVGWPGLKVPEEPYRWAAALNSSVPPGSRVVAPYWISRWVTTFHGHAHPLEVRPAYLQPHLQPHGAGGGATPRGRLSAREIEDRHWMSAYAGGTALSPDAPARFALGLARYDVRAVCLAESRLGAEARSLLRDAGFALSLRGRGHEIWTRADSIH